MEKWSKKLGVQLTNWNTLQTADNTTLQSEISSNGTMIQAYKDRMKADNISINAVKAYKEFIDNKVIAAMKNATNKSETYKAMPKNFELHEAQYRQSYLQATLAQAKTLVVIDKADKAQVKKYNTYITKLEKSVKTAEKKVEEAATAAKNEANGGSSAGMIIGIVVGVLAIIGAIVLVKKCKSDDGEGEGEKQD